MLHNYGVRRARDGVGDVRELEGGQEEAPTLRLALARACIVPREHLENYLKNRMTRNPRYHIAVPRIHEKVLNNRMGRNPRNHIMVPRMP